MNPSGSIKIAFVLYDGLTILDFIGVYDPVTRLKTMGFLPGLSWDLCAFSDPVHDPQGLGLTPTRAGEPLSGYDLVIVPGGIGSRARLEEPAFLDWLRTAAGAPRLASVCTGALLLAGAGLLEGRQAATHPSARDDLRRLGVEAVDARLVEDGNVLSSGGVTAAIDLGLYLCLQLGGEDALPADPPADGLPVRSAARPPARRIGWRGHLRRSAPATQPGPPDHPRNAD